MYQIASTSTRNGSTSIYAAGTFNEMIAELGRIRDSLLRPVEEGDYIPLLSTAHRTHGGEPTDLTVAWPDGSVDVYVVRDGSIAPLGAL